MHSAKEIGDLARAERHIAESRQRVRQQTELVEHLRQHGRDASEAEERLAATEGELKALRRHQRNVVSALAETD